MKSFFIGLGWEMDRGLVNINIVHEIRHYTKLVKILYIFFLIHFYFNNNLGFYFRTFPYRIGWYIGINNVMTRNKDTLRHPYPFFSRIFLRHKDIVACATTLASHISETLNFYSVRNGLS